MIFTIGYLLEQKLPLSIDKPTKNNSMNNPAGFLPEYPNGFLRTRILPI
jgi:hypothetical protein